MNIFHVIEHAKNYLDMLAAGTDPISKELISDDSVVSKPQLKKCFQFISAVLQEVLQNNGLVLLDADDANTHAPASVPVTVNGNNYELVRKKVAFCMTPEQKNEVLISRLPINGLTCTQPVTLRPSWEATSHSDCQQDRSALSFR